MSDTINADGRTYHLGKLPPDPVKRAMFPPVAPLTAPKIDPAEWQPVDRRKRFNMGDWSLDQRSHGSCVGFSSAAALARLRVAEGQQFQRLSGAFIYSHINGGRDNGAIISDSLDVLKQQGTCLETECGWDQIYPNQIPNSARQTAKRFKVLEAYRVDTWAEAISAIQLGFILVGAVMVGDNFFRLDNNGVSGFDRGPGNHAVCFDGCGFLPSGQPFLDLPNSWGLTFGENGRTKITEKHFESVQQDCYAMRAAINDPQESGPPAAE